MLKRYDPAIASQFRKLLSDFDLTSDEQRKAVAEEVTKDLAKDFISDDVLSSMRVEIEYFEEGQKLAFRSKSGTKAYVHDPGTNAPASQICTTAVYLETDLVSVRPVIEMGQQRRLGSYESLKEDAYNEMRGHQYATIWSVAKAACPSDASLSNYWSGTASSIAKLNALNSGIDYVADQIGSDVVALVGRRSAFSFLSDPSAWSTSTAGNNQSERAREQLDFNLYAGQHRGVPIVLLPNYKDGWGATGIDASNILVLGKDTIKMGIDRPLGFAEQFNAINLKWTWHLFMKYGIGVINPTRNALVNIA